MRLLLDRMERALSLQRPYNDLTVILTESLQFDRNLLRNAGLNSSIGFPLKQSFRSETDPRYGSAGPIPRRSRQRAPHEVTSVVNSTATIVMRRDNEAVANTTLEFHIFDPSNNSSGLKERQRQFNGRLAVRFFVLRVTIAPLTNCLHVRKNKSGVIFAGLRFQIADHFADNIPEVALPIARFSRLQWHRLYEATRESLLD
jgi:hypothetical protein